MNEYFLIEWELCALLTEVAPLVPGIFCKAVDTPLLSRCGKFCVAAMELKEITCGQVVDRGTLFGTVIPKSKGEFRFF